MPTRSVLLAALLLPVAACTDWDLYGIGGPDFEGVYTYAGTVDGELGDVVSGAITITRQRGRRADVTIEWSYIERGEEILYIASDRPAIASLSEDGSIRFEFEGDLDLGNRVVGFRLEHDGRLWGDRLDGFWRLVTGTPTTDVGDFTARRY